jgi:hypothetical protein
VKSDWIKKSLEQKKWLSEEKFEAVDWFPGCKRSRLARENLSKLFTAQGLIFLRRQAGKTSLSQKEDSRGPIPSWPPEGSTGTVCHTKWWTGKSPFVALS